MSLRPCSSSYPDTTEGWVWTARLCVIDIHSNGLISGFRWEWDEEQKRPLSHWHCAWLNRGAYNSSFVAAIRSGVSSYLTGRVPKSATDLALCMDSTKRVAKESQKWGSQTGIIMRRLNHPVLRTVYEGRAKIMRIGGSSLRNLFQNFGEWLSVGKVKGPKYIYIRTSNSVENIGAV
jgi:hypothetical protein